MDVRTKKALPGFLSRAPQLKYLSDGLPLFIAQLGQKRYREEDDGTLALVSTEYVRLVMFGEASEAAFNDFVTGDDVVAVGSFKTRSYVHRGEHRDERQFQASKLFFDTTRRRYLVERAPRTTQQGLVRASATTVEFRAPQRNPTAAVGR